MSFTRTLSGITNQHLFYRADAVVYVEGGSQSFSYQEICNGNSGTSSPDILYWQAIFRFYAPETKVVFKPAGSKGTLLKLANNITSGLISNTYVAMDQDFDRFRNTKIINEGIFYSWGYSWENDLLQDVVIKDAVFALCPIDRTTHEQKVEEKIEEVTLKFIRNIRWFIFADILMSLANGGLFDRKKWPKYMKSDGGQHGEPYFSPVDLRQNIEAINKSKGTQRYHGIAESVDVKRDCFGHIIGVYACRLFSHLLSLFSGSPGLSTINSCGILAQSLGHNLAHPSLCHLKNHHEAQFSFLNP
jgi:hypothetical protein